MSIRRFIASALATVITAFTVPAAVSTMEVKASAASSSYQTGTYQVNYYNGVNVRSGPSTGYGRVGASPNGSTFRVTSVSGDWGYTPSIYTCGYGYKAGYVHLGYARLLQADTPAVTVSSTSSSSLNLNAMANYAASYWKYYNTGRYRSYKSSNVDCCNYVSQLMVAGGLPETSAWHGSYDYSYVTDSFCNVADFINYMRSTYRVKYYNNTSLSWSYKDGSSFSINDVQVGDCVTMNGTYGRNHIMYVLGKSGNSLILTGHTNDRYNYYLNIAYVNGVLKTSQISF